MSKDLIFYWAVMLLLLAIIVTEVLQCLYF